MASSGAGGADSKVRLAGEPTRRWALFGYGFRRFFLAAGLSGVLLVPWWSASPYSSCGSWADVCSSRALTGSPAEHARGCHRVRLP